jgi:TatD DNase family protein
MTVPHSSSVVHHSSFLVPRSSFVDTHAHLDVEEFDADREQVLGRARESGLAAIVCPAITADSSEAVVRLAEGHREIHAAVGIQPNYCGQATQEDWDRIAALAGHPRVVAVGETGLDRHWDFTPFDVQRDYFDRHLRLAQARDLPAIVHCREAEADLIPMLREVAARGPLRGVLHSFSGDQALADECLRLGLYVSFSGAVTYTNKKFEPLREVACRIPADRILIETDSPYLVPHPLRGKQPRNEPAWIVHTAQRLADLRRETLAEFAAQTTVNARRLFGTRLPPVPSLPEGI